MNIIKNKKITYGISILIILVGLIMFIINGLNYGIDFTGGTMIELNVGKFVETSSVRKIIDEYDTNASVIHSGENKESIIIRSKKDLSNEETTAIVRSFVSEFGMDQNNFQTQKFGPFMGKEIRNRSILSIIIATLLMLVYITFRFQFKFGVAAVLALVHDVLVTLAIYSILRLPVNSSFIAAVLTIVGYSINDTIIVFDRIREELKYSPKGNLESVVNDSVKKSLRRTILTTTTTLIAVATLYIMGTEDVKVLALPLMLGIISGTYSSIFIAAPIWHSLKKGRA